MNNLKFKLNNKPQKTQQNPNRGSISGVINTNDPSGLKPAAPAVSLQPPSINEQDDFRYIANQQAARPRSNLNKKKIIIKLVIALCALMLVIGIYFGVRLYLAAASVIESDDRGSLLLSGMEVSPSELNREGDGRINVLLVGIRGEDTGYGNGSIEDRQVDLSDTNIIATLDSHNNTAGLFSVPRDLYVDIPGYGGSRINNAHSFGEADGYETGGVGLLMDTIEANLEIPIHYYIKVNLDGFTQAVDAVGGVDVYVERTIVDPIFSDEELGYPGPYTLQSGWHQLNGQEALLYARSRKTSARGDFDRNDRQREILLSIKEKALSAGTFADPRKVSGLLSAASNNVRTNIQLGDISSLYSAIESVPDGSLQSTGLSTDEDGYLQNASIDGASVVVPTSGTFNDITGYFFDTFPDRFIQQEAATINVYGASYQSEEASEVAMQLAKFGYKVNESGSIGYSVDSDISIYTSGDNPYTENYLEKRFNTTARSNSQLPNNTDQTADFTVVVGQHSTEVNF